MHKDRYAWPSQNVIKRHVLRSLGIYWRGLEAEVSNLPIARYELTAPPRLPLRLLTVAVPPWLNSATIDGYVMVPVDVLPQQISRADVNWRDVDWFLAIFLLLESCHEREFERLHGSIHSYSFKLKGWDERAWENAWVNRIALFLSAWASRETRGFHSKGTHSIPVAKIEMTHDVDAIRKTAVIKCKYLAFSGYNICRALAKRDFPKARLIMSRAIRFAVSKGDWIESIVQLANLEVALDISATFHFAVPHSSRRLVDVIFDPSYDATGKEAATLMHHLVENHHKVGIHPTFRSWNDKNEIKNQRERLEKALNLTVDASRQHWLRFSWRDTWPALFESGIRLDRTLMFNDRSGFRNSCAVSWHPFNWQSGDSTSLRAQPTVIMDSHLYDYQDYDDSGRNNRIRTLLDEICLVGGEASILWHPHTLSQDYQWNKGFEVCLDYLSDRKIVGT